MLQRDDCRSAAGPIAGPLQRSRASARSRRAGDVPDASMRARGAIHSSIEEKLLTRGERVCRTPDRMALRLG